MYTVIGQQWVALLNELRSSALKIASRTPMEIPSSSPGYSPLKPETGTYKLDASDQVLLFPSQTQDVAETQDAQPSSNLQSSHSQQNQSGPVQSNQDQSYRDRQFPNSSNPPTDDQFYEYNGTELHRSSQFDNPGDLTQDDPEVTIFSDSEYEVPDTESSDVEIVPERNTQNYLDALLTESVLESLPLPTDEKNMMRKKRPEGYATH